MRSSSLKTIVPLIVALLTLVAALFSGCGSSPPSLNPDEVGSLLIKISWPGSTSEAPASETRFIPPAAKSLRAYVYPEGDLTTVQATATIDTPATQLTLSNVPGGAKDVRLCAFDGLGATGNVIAYGVCQTIPDTRPVFLPATTGGGER